MPVVQKARQKWNHPLNGIHCSVVRIASLWNAVTVGDGRHNLMGFSLDAKECQPRGAVAGDDPIRVFRAHMTVSAASAQQEGIEERAVRHSYFDRIALRIRYVHYPRELFRGSPENLIFVVYRVVNILGLQLMEMTSTVNFGEEIYLS